MFVFVCFLCEIISMGMNQIGSSYFEKMNFDIQNHMCINDFEGLSCRKQVLHDLVI